MLTQNSTDPLEIAKLPIDWPKVAKHAAIMYAKGIFGVNEITPETLCMWPQLNAAEAIQANKAVAEATFELYLWKSSSKLNSIYRNNIFGRTVSYDRTDPVELFKEIFGYPVEEAITDPETEVEKLWRNFEF